MTQESHDQEVVKRLKQQYRESEHNWHDEYDEQGRLLRLDLSHLKLSLFPPDLWQLNNLQRLNLRKNRLRKLPAELWQLSNLQDLDLSDNQLRTLPPGVGQLSNLQDLNLSDNQLRTLPPGVGKLVNLQWLNIGNNQLRTLPPEIGQLTNLQWFYLDKNQLETLPSEVGLLTNLQKLDLFENRIKTLPPEVGNLINLRELSLNLNPLRALPSEVGQLIKLQKLGLPDWLLLPPEIVRQDISTILAYLRACSQTTERYEAKVILVGEGSVGKSSLLQALREGEKDVRGSFLLRQKYPFPQSHSELPLTHGIDTKTLVMPHPASPGRFLTLSIWDFGGQDLYQATHQFFLTRRSVYLLVWNARQGPDACRVRFWLETIRALAPDASVLLVATHADEWCQQPLDLHRYQQNYPQIIGQCMVSNKDGCGLDALSKQIAIIASKTSLAEQPWPHSWMEAEQELLARPEHHLDRADFLQICARHGIAATEALEVFGPFLHDLGKILFFHDDFLVSNLIVLKPNWISKAISRILQDSQVQQAHGLLHHQELARIWSKDDQGWHYDPALYPIFLRLMERFDLSYQLETETPGQPATQSLIPLLLPSQRPASLPIVPSVVSADLVRVEMRYTLGFVPKGLIGWLLVRTHRYSQQLHWREGAHLAYHGQQAHIELDEHQREISLVAWGAFPYTFFTILKETLDAILERFQGLHIRREVPCVCLQQQAQPHWHDFDFLESQLQNGSSEIVCQSSAHIPLSTLLYGIHAGATTQVAITAQQAQQLVTYPAPVSGEEQKRRFDILQQSQESLWRDLAGKLMRLTNFEMQKEQTPCPSWFLLEREAGHRFNPKDWMSRAYRLHLLCQYLAGPHLIAGEPGYPLRKGKGWWKAMSPWLRRLVTVLEMGVPLGKAVGEVFDQVDTERLANQIDLFYEILTDLPDLDALDSASETGGNLSVEQHLEGAALRVLFHFLDTADSAHHWHGLDKVLTPNGTILWVCERHKREFVN
jgi:internalin A